MDEIADKTFRYGGYSVLGNEVNNSERFCRFDNFQAQQVTLLSMHDEVTISLRIDYDIESSGIFASFVLGLTEISGCNHIQRNSIMMKHIDENFFAFC